MLWSIPTAQNCCSAVFAGAAAVYGAFDLLGATGRPTLCDLAAKAPQNRGVWEDRKGRITAAMAQIPALPENLPDHGWTVKGSCGDRFRDEHAACVHRV
jgi:hypothetical protein